MFKNKCAEVRMEENYMRIIIDYNNKEEKKKLEKTLKKVEKKIEIEMEVIHRPYEDNEGDFSIEFPTIGERAKREAGEVCIKILNDIGISRCER